MEKTWAATGPKLAARKLSSGASNVFQKVSSRFITEPMARVRASNSGCSAVFHSWLSWVMSACSTGCTVPVHSVMKMVQRFCTACAAPARIGWP